MSTPKYQLPSQVQEVTISDRIIITGSTAPVSPSNTGSIRFNSGTHHLEFSENGGSYIQFGSGGGGGGSMTIGDPVIGSAAQSILFIDPDGYLQQDNANFMWDDVNVRLGLATNTPTHTLENAGTTKLIGHIGINNDASSNYLIDILNDGIAASSMAFRTNGTSDYAAVDLYKSNTTFVGSFGYAGSTSMISSIQNKIFLSLASVDFNIWDNTNSATRFSILGTTDGYVGIGTASPTTRLDVNGHIKVDGYLIDLSGGAITNQVLQYNGTKFLPASFAGAYAQIQNNGSNVTQRTTINLSTRLLATDVSSKTFIDLAASGISANTYNYGNGSITFDSYGRATSASSASNIVTQAYSTVKNNTTSLTQRSVLNFTPRFLAADDATDGYTYVDLAISGSAGGYSYGNGSITFDAYGRATSQSSATNLALTTTTISTTAPLTGGGDLSANRTISIPKAATSTDGYLSQADWNTFNNKGSVSSVATNSTLTGGPITSTGTLGINLSNLNTWVAKQNFSGHIAVDGYTFKLNSGAMIGQILGFDGNNFVPLDDGLVDVESFRQSIFTDAQTIQAALNTGKPLSFPNRIYTINAGETCVNTLCHLMFGNSTTFKIGNGAISNSDGSHTDFTAFMQIQGIDGFQMLGKFILDGNRANQTYPATGTSYGRGTATLPAAGKRTNAILEIVPATDNVTPSKNILLDGLEVKNAYLNGIVCWQTVNTTIRNCYTHENSANGIAAGGVSNFNLINSHHFRDGYSQFGVWTDGDRSGLQIREMPFDYTAAALGMPSIPVQVPSVNDINIAVSIINCSAEECGVESWFVRAAFPVIISSCYSLNSNYNRLVSASFHGAHIWVEWSQTMISDCQVVQTTNNTGLGLQPPDALVCQTLEGNAAVGSSPLNINGTFRSVVSNFMASCGSDTNNNFNRGIRVYSSCVVENYSISGTQQEAIRIENDTNFNLLPPHDVKLINGVLTNIDGYFAVEVNRFGGSVLGNADNLIINNLRVSGLNTSSINTDDHAIIDFNTTMQGYQINNFTATGLVFDGYNAGSNQNYNGIRLRCSPLSKNILVNFTDGYNLYSPIRTFGYNNLKMTGNLNSVHRIYIMDGYNTIDGYTTSQSFDCEVNAYNVSSELFFLTNMSTPTFQAFRVENCDFTGVSTCRTFPSGTGNITTTADNFFNQVSSFFWLNNAENYGSANTAVNVYDMRRSFSSLANLNAAIPYYIGEIVFRTDDSSVWIGEKKTTTGWGLIQSAIAERASASDLQLTTTSGTTVVTFTPSAQGNFVVYGYYRVITATTNLTLSLTWTDGTGSQSSALLPLSAQTVGSYVVPLTYINATAAAITVTATAGTANQIFVSASILSV